MEYKLVMRILVKETMTWYGQICKFSDTHTRGYVYWKDQAVKCIMYKCLLKLTAALFAGVIFDKSRRAPASELNQQGSMQGSCDSSLGKLYGSAHVIAGHLIIHCAVFCLDRGRIVQDRVPYRLWKMLARMLIYAG